MRRPSIFMVAWQWAGGELLKFTRLLKALLCHYIANSSLWPCSAALVKFQIFVYRHCSYHHHQEFIQKFVMGRGGNQNPGMHLPNWLQTYLTTDVKGCLFFLFDFLRPNWTLLFSRKRTHLMGVQPIIGEVFQNRSKFTIIIITAPIFYNCVEYRLNLLRITTVVLSFLKTYFKYFIICILFNLLKNYFNPLNPLQCLTSFLSKPNT